MYMLNQVVLYSCLACTIFVLQSLENNINTNIYSLNVMQKMTSNTMWFKLLAFKGIFGNLGKRGFYSGLAPPVNLETTVNLLLWGQFQTSRHVIRLKFSFHTDKTYNTSRDFPWLDVGMGIASQTVILPFDITVFPSRGSKNRLT